MRAVAPEVETVEQPVQFLDCQDNRLVAGFGRCFESLGLQALEPKAEAVAFPIQNLHAVSGLVEENEKHRVEHGDLDIQFDQRGQTINGFSEVHGLAVEIDFSTLASGRIMSCWLRRKSGAQHRGSDGRFECGVHGALTNPRVTS